MAEMHGRWKTLGSGSGSGYEICEMAIRMALSDLVHAAV
jgi:hypothetical protein